MWNNVTSTVWLKGKGKNVRSARGMVVCLDEKVLCLFLGHIMWYDYILLISHFTFLHYNKVWHQNLSLQWWIPNWKLKLKCFIMEVEDQNSVSRYSILLTHPSTPHAFPCMFCHMTSIQFNHSSLIASEPFPPSPLTAYINIVFSC